MCGIIAGFHRKETVNEAILEQFEDQNSRGQNGFGAMFINKDGSFDIKRATGAIKSIIDVKLQPTKMMIFHHRQPSSSSNRISQTHPILISHGSLKHDYYFVHNGCIYGHADRKKKQEDELGYQYSTGTEVTSYNRTETQYNDSETLGFDLARFIEKQTETIDTNGSAAFIMAQVSKKTGKITRIFYGRNSSNPLKLAKSQDQIFLSSEGKGEEIKPDMLYSFDLDDWKIKKRACQIKTSSFEKKTEDKDDEEWETALTPGAASGRSFSSYNDDYGTRGRGYDTAQTGLMTWDEEQSFGDILDTARGEIDLLEELVKEARGSEDLYLIDPAEIVKEIARNIVRAIDFARNSVTNSLLNDINEEPKVETETKTETKTESQIGFLPN